jgi:hypothetical protein
MSVPLYIPTFNNPTYTIVQDNMERLLIGGSFSYYRGQPFGKIIRLNLNGSINTKTS